ncbi:MAG TPA: hypothetical protein VN783_05660 [Thermoanaerobaculia bacterium]|nr:hypothetical protein [Thermoanaerobaculia bacterium]
MVTEKKKGKIADDLRPEYDLATLGEGVRGKYYERARAESNFVVLDSDRKQAPLKGRTE